jgi:hypothetical protein
MGGPDYSLSGSRSDKRRQGERRATSAAIELFEQPLAASQPGQQVVPATRRKPGTNNSIRV